MKPFISERNVRATSLVSVDYSRLKLPFLHIVEPDMKGYFQLVPFLFCIKINLLFNFFLVNLDQMINEATFFNIK